MIPFVYGNKKNLSMLINQSHGQSWGAGKIMTQEEPIRCVQNIQLLDPAGVYKVCSICESLLSCSLIQIKAFGV